VQKPIHVANAEVDKATKILVFAASQTSGSAKIVSYHTIENDPRGTVGNRWELKENITLAMIGKKIKVNTITM
jgi:hypothetical protein